MTVALSYKPQFLLNLLVASCEVLLSDLSHLCRLTSSLLKLTFAGPFQNICNFTQLSLYGAHGDPFTCWKFCLVDQFEMMNFQNAPLSHCRKFSFLFSCYPKGSNPLQSTILPPCMSHCSTVCKN